MTRLRFGLALGMAVVLVAGCSDDGITPAVSGTGDGDGSGPFMTTLPPNTSADDGAGTVGPVDDGSETSAGPTTGVPDPSTSSGPAGDSSSGATDATGESSGDTGVGVVMPAAGEVVISEIMQNPAVLADEAGEWFELYNPSPTDGYQLQGCTIEGAVADTPFVIDVDLPIAPQGYVVFATMSAGGPGFTPDFQWDSASFQLNNTTDTVRLVCDMVVIDEVTYDNGATFPDPTGASMTLDPGSLDATANDDGMNWCEATSDYNGDLGTPGADNDPCM